MQGISGVGVRLFSVFAFIFVLGLPSPTYAPAYAKEPVEPPSTSAGSASKKPAISPTDECEALLTDAIPSQWVEKMLSQGRAADPQIERLREIVQKNGFNNAAINIALVRHHNPRYTLTLEQGPITNQKQSGRCWIFAGLNMLRSSLIAEGRVPRDFEFSENYLHFFNMLEKSNRYLERVLLQAYKQDSGIALSRRELRSAFSPDFGDGGWYEDFSFLVSKYGLLPKEAMPETKSSENTGVLLDEMRRHLAQTAEELLAEAARSKGKDSAATPDAKYLARARAIKSKGMQNLWEVLATHLGDPPQRFEVRSESLPVRKGLVSLTNAAIKRFTPQQYAAEIVKFNPHDYVVIASTPKLGRGVYEQPDSGIGYAEDGKPTFNIRFMNVDLARMEELAITSLDGGLPVWFTAEIGKDVDHNSGIMHPGIFQRDAVYGTDSRAPRKLGRFMEMFLGIATPSHAMLLTGYDRPDAGAPVVKFRNENSWGTGHGTDGVYHLYREWFHENVFQIVVHRKFLSKDELKAWQSSAKPLSKDDEPF